jgi:integrase
VLTWGRKNSYQVAPFVVSQLPVRKGDRVEVFSDTEIDEMLRWSRRCYPEQHRLLLFLLNTGCRKGEAIAARWNWIDARNQMITIPASRYWQPKSGRSRDIPIPDALLPVLTGPHAHPEAVFPSLRGNPYTAFPLWQFREMLAATKIKGRPHMFRHTFASHFLAATNGDMHLLAQIMGHSHTRVTELYAHLVPGRLDRARNAVNIGEPRKPGTVRKMRA